MQIRFAAAPAGKNHAAIDMFGKLMPPKKPFVMRS
jgi:hypothetical protein